MINHPRRSFGNVLVFLCVRGEKRGKEGNVDQFSLNTFQKLLDPSIRMDIVTNTTSSLMHIASLVEVIKRVDQTSTN